MQLRSLVAASVVLAVLAGCGPGIEFTADGNDSRFTSGEFELVGDLRLPDGEGPFPAIVMVHGDGPQDRTGNGAYATVMNLMVDSGYAVFAWDKPGTRDSEGEFEPGSTLFQRADILVDGVEALATHEAIDPNRIGVWGLSQAGWVVPRALDQTDQISFVIMVSGGAEPSPHQTGYLIGAQMRCAGHSEEESAGADDAFVQYAYADEYAEYREAMEYIVEFPTAARYGGNEVREEEAWSPWPSDADAFFDPVTVLEHTTIPVLAFFGEKDTAVDPIQGSQAYEDALTEAGNTDFQVVFIEGANHVMKMAATGCFDEPSAGPYAQQYLDTLEAWLIDHLG